MQASPLPLQYKIRPELSKPFTSGSCKAMRAKKRYRYLILTAVLLGMGCAGTANGIDPAVQQLSCDGKILYRLEKISQAKWVDC